MLALFAAALFVQSPANPPVDPAAAGFDAAKLTRIAGRLTDLTESGAIPGAVAVVATRDGVVYRTAVGLRDAEAGVPMSADTLFRLASMTKPVTSTAVLQLAEAGTLSLDDPVSKYIRGFENPTVLEPTGDGGFTTRPAARVPTVRDLLTHTSGVTYGFAGGPLGERYRAMDISDGLDGADVELGMNAARIAAQPLLFDPGTRWEYGLSTDLLGRVVEVASGSRFDRYLDRRVFTPLAMHDTSFNVPDAKRDRLAGLFTPGPDGRVRPVTERGTLGNALVDPADPLRGATAEFAGDPGYLSGGGGLVGTADDYLRFLRMLANGGELDGVRILSPESVRAMISNRTGDLPLKYPLHGDGFGYGVGVLSESAAASVPESAGSYGWAGAYLTYFWVDPDSDVIGLLMTQLLPYGRAGSLREDFKGWVYDARG